MIHPLRKKAAGESRVEVCADAVRSCQGGVVPANWDNV